MRKLLLLDTVEVCTVRPKTVWLPLSLSPVSTCAVRGCSDWGCAVLMMTVWLWPPLLDVQREGALGGVLLSGKSLNQ